MKFVKMHGASNDYIFTETDNDGINWAEIAQKISNRHTGVGGDGLILIMPSQKAHLRMKMFNADGSEGEMCGNGIRCVAKYAFDNDLIKSSISPLRVETAAGILKIKVIKTENDIIGAEVSMGTPEFNPKNIPAILPEPETNESLNNNKNFTKPIAVNVPINNENLTLHLVSMGNPHAVCFIDQNVSDFPLHEIGPQIENHPMFPNRINFEIVNLHKQNFADVRVWERGSGETMACGTGACAVGVVSMLKKQADSPLEVKLPGGSLLIHWDQNINSEIIMEGPAEETFRGEWSI
tara:strand:- start:1718 stop:2599 length:882 start_codon:yes stop_codon:yes gene_type:complete